MTSDKTEEQASFLTGTGFLLRFYLRLDRVRILIWTVSLFALIYLSVVAMEGAYPTPEALAGRAALMTNPAAIMMTGPAFSLDDYTFGAMLANELSLWTFLPAAIMSILLAVRHTRQDEETGRMEVLRALPVGRFSPITATYLVVTIANLSVAAAVALATIVAGQPVLDSLAFGVATGVTGLVFGTIAVLAAQLTEHSRTATGIALGAFGLAALVRGVGDVIEPTGSWLSWLSPVAWAQQTKLYVDLRWWPLLLSLALTAALLIASITLSRRRDLGAGILQSKPGTPDASAALLSPLGLAHRLLSGSFFAWTIGLLLFAVAFGSLAASLDSMLDDNPALAEWMPISSTDLTLSFASVILMFLALGPLILVVSAILQLRGEEQAGRVEGMLATGSSRRALLSRWVFVATLWAAASLLILGFGAGLGLAAATGEATWVWDLSAASAAYLPAVLLSSALAVALYGMGPKWTFIAWSYVGFIAVETFLGDLLKLPEWIRSLSPLYQTPLVPFDNIEAAPLLVMFWLAIILYIIGIDRFRRRDIAA